MPSWRELRASESPPTDAASLAEALVRREVLTPWQSEMLLKGKRKGFHLGPYVLLRPLGQGAMGQVFLAKHVMMDRRCAIKILATKYREDPDLLARFQVEAKAIAALDHPHIVRAYDFNRDMIAGKEVFYLVMEYVEGQDLQRLVEKDGPMPYQAAAEFIRQAAVGLAHAHEAGFVHRDVKPGNLLVDTKGVLKILDLGLARLARRSGVATSGDVGQRDARLHRPRADPKQARLGRPGKRLQSWPDVLLPPHRPPAVREKNDARNPGGPLQGTLGAVGRRSPRHPL